MTATSRRQSQHKKQRSFRRTLIAIIWSAAIIPLVLLSIEFINSSNQSQQQVAQQRLEYNVRTAVVESSQLLQSAMLNLDRMASDGNIIRSASFEILSVRTIEQMQRYLERFPMFHSIMMVDKNLFQSEVFPTQSLRLNIEPFHDLITQQFTSEQAYIDPKTQFAIAPISVVDPSRKQDDYVFAMVRPILQPSDSLTQPFSVISTFVVLANMSDLVQQSLESGDIDTSSEMIRISFHDQVVYDTFTNDDSLVLSHEETLVLGYPEDAFKINVALPNSEFSLIHLIQSERTYFLLIVLSLVIIFAVAWFLTQRLSQPIAELRDITSSLAQHDFNLPTIAFTSVKNNFKEFREVVQLLERMSDKIGEQFEKLNLYNQEIKIASHAMEASANKANRQNDVLNTLMQYALFIQHEKDIDRIARLTVDTFSQLTKSKLGLVIYRNQVMKGSQVMEDVPANFLQRINAYNQNFLSHDDIQTINDLDEGYRLLPIFVKDEIDGYVVLESESDENMQQYAIEMFVTVLQSALEQEFLRLQLEKLANSDALTGLYNRHYFDHKFALYTHRATTEKFPFALMLIDVNGLKNVNDTIGHAAGDALIQRVAQLLKETTRQSDVAARTGGDEFIILLEQVDGLFCNVLQQRLSMLASETSFSFEGKSINVSFSIGFASTDQDPVTQLYDLADSRMYQEKQRYYQQKTELT